MSTETYPREADADEPKSNVFRIEAASRFNSQIPLEYAYGAWGKLPDSKGDSQVLAPFRSVTLEQLTAFAEQRVRALAHIERSFKFKSAYIEKPAIAFPKLLTAGTDATLSQTLEEFLYMEHHASLQSKLLSFALPIDRRMLAGLSLLLRYQGPDHGKKGERLHRFGIDFRAVGADPIATMNGIRLRESDWVLLNPAITDKGKPPSPSQMGTDASPSSTNSAPTMCCWI